MGDRRQAVSPGAQRPARPGPSAHGRTRLRRHASGGSVDGPLALPRPVRRRPSGPGAPGQPLPRWRPHRELPVGAAPEGVADAPGQPAHRRRRGAGQDRGSRPRSVRAAAAPPHPSRAGADARLAPPPVERRDAGEVFAALRDRGPAEHGEAAPPNGHGRQPLALLQPCGGVVPLPAPAGRDGAVPGGLRPPDSRRLSPPAMGPADRRRVPQPDAVPVRRRQRAVQDAALCGPALRAPALPVGHAPQRPHPLVHRTAGDAGPGPLLAHQRDDARHARTHRRRGDSPAQARHQRDRDRQGDRPPLLHPAPAQGPDARLRPARGPPFCRLRRLSQCHPGACRGRRQTPAPRRGVRGRDLRQAAAVLPDRLRRVVEPGQAGFRGPAGRGRSTACHGGTLAAPRHGRRPRGAAAPGHGFDGRGGVAEELRGRLDGRGPRDRRRPCPAGVRLGCRRCARRVPNAHCRRPLRPALEARRGLPSRRGSVPRQ